MVRVDPAKLLDLAERVQRLNPNYTHPERFFIDKDDLRRELQAMAQGRG